VEGRAASHGEPEGEGSFEGFARVGSWEGVCRCAVGVAWWAPSLWFPPSCFSLFVCCVPPCAHLCYRLGWNRLNSPRWVCGAGGCVVAQGAAAFRLCVPPPLPSLLPLPPCCMPSCVGDPVLPGHVGLASWQCAMSVVRTVGVLSWSCGVPAPPPSPPPLAQQHGPWIRQWSSTPAGEWSWMKPCEVSRISSLSQVVFAQSCAPLACCT
jgi:hypothetical protein